MSDTEKEVPRRHFLQAVGVFGAIAAAERVLDNPVAHALAPTPTPTSEAVASPEITASISREILNICSSFIRGVLYPYKSTMSKWINCTSTTSPLKTILPIYLLQ